MVESEYKGSPVGAKHLKPHCHSELFEESHYIMDEGTKRCFDELSMTN